MTDGAADIAAKMRAARANGADPEPLRIIDPRLWQDQPMPERRWVVPWWIPHGVVTSLYGPGSIGKSLVALQLITAAALGQRWIGLEVATTRTLGVFCEDEDHELQRRLFAILKLHKRAGLLGSTRDACDFDDLGAMRLLSRVGEDNLLMVFGRDGRGETTPFFVASLPSTRSPTRSAATRTTRGR
jgi:hypothetical protein